MATPNRGRMREARCRRVLPWATRRASRNAAEILSARLPHRRVYRYTHLGAYTCWPRLSPWHCVTPGKKLRVGAQARVAGARGCVGLLGGSRACELGDEGVRSRVLWFVPVGHGGFILVCSGVISAFFGFCSWNMFRAGVICEVSKF